MARIGGHVFVATTGEIEDDEIVFGEARGAFDEAGDGMGGFERRDNAFGPREEARGNLIIIRNRASCPLVRRGVRSLCDSIRGNTARDRGGRFLVGRGRQ